MKLQNNLLTKFTLFSLSTLLLQAAPSGFYIEAGGGVGLGDTQRTKSATFVYNQKYLTEFSVGYQADLFRFEFEERYKSDTLHSANTDGEYFLKVDGKLTSNSQLLNVYFSGYNSSKIFTTIGAGAGVTTLSLGNSIKDSGILSAQGMLSLGYPITETFIATAKYTYFYTLKSDDFLAHGDNALSFTLRYIFD